MNDWQIAQQIEHIVRGLEWPDTQPLVREAITTPYDELGVLEFHMVPIALIRVGSQNPVPQRQDEVNMTFEVLLVIHSGGDKSGRSNLIGKDRQAGARGRGLLEYQEILLPALEGLGGLTQKDGFLFEFLGSSRAEIAVVGDLGDSAIVARTYSFSARATRQRTYISPERLRASGSPTVTLTWILPPDRFDREKVLLFRNTVKITAFGQAGNVAITIPGGDLGTTATDSPGSGTFFYAIIAAYDDIDDGVLSYSDPSDSNVRITV